VRDLWESFKVDHNEECHINDRFVNVKDLVSRKLNRKGKRIDELI